MRRAVDWGLAIERRVRHRLSGWAGVAAWAAVLAAVLLWPITRAGYLLGHDMVFTPRQPLDLASIGVSTASPRAVPLDALVALAERVLDGAVVGRLAVIVPLVAVGVGAAALLGSRSLSARLASCTLAIWNPFVVERLALGQWALLWAYAALPWLILVILRCRGARMWFAAAVAVAAASITPTGGLIAAVTLVAVTAGLHRGRHEVAGAAGLAVVLQLPWLVPSLLTTASATSDPAAVAVFSARPEHPGGALLSVLGGGGIWDADVVPGSRAGPLAWLGLVVVVAASAFGVRRLIVLLGAGAVVALTGLSAVGLLLAVGPSIPGGDAVLRAAVAHVPGAGLLRDSQKWILPLVLLEALLAGAAVERIAQRVHTASWRLVLVVAAVALPVILLPDAPAALRPTLDPVHYPHDWSVVQRRMDGADAVVLPFGSYRGFPWAPGRSVLDPAPRAFRGGIVVDDRLSISGRVLRGEDPRARAVATALAAGADLPRRLAHIGVSWVIIERGTPGRVPELAGLAQVYLGNDLALYRVPGPITRHSPDSAHVGAVLVADALAVLALLGLAVAAASTRRGRPPHRTAQESRPESSEPSV